MNLINNLRKENGDLISKNKALIFEMNSLKVQEFHFFKNNLFVYQEKIEIIENHSNKKIEEVIKINTELEKEVKKAERENKKLRSTNENSKNYSKSFSREEEINIKTNPSLQE